MKKFIFDIQRFDDLATIRFGGDWYGLGGGIMSISSGITAANDTLLTGSENDDTLATSGQLNIIDSPFNGANAIISLSGGNDSVNIENGTVAMQQSAVTISSGENSDTINIVGGNGGIAEIAALGSISPVSIDGGSGNDYINIVASAKSESAGNTAAISGSAVTVIGDDGNDTIKIGSESSLGMGIISALSPLTLPNGNVDSAPVYIDGGSGNDFISIYGGYYGIMGSDAVTINGNAGSDEIFINSIDNTSQILVMAGAGDSISVGSGGANYLFDSTEAVTINGATFTANSADTSASLESSNNTTSIKSAWNGTVELSGTNSLADIDGSIVSAAGNYQIVNGKFSGNSPIVPPVDTDMTVTSGWTTIFSSEGSTVIDNDNNVVNGTDNAENIQSANISNTLRAVLGNGGNDTVSISGSVNGIEFSSVTLSGDSGDDSINIYGGVDAIHPSTVSIVGGIGDDTISIHGGNEGIHGGTSEAVENKTAATIDGGEGDDKIIIQADNDTGIDISKVTITGGSGNDLISISGGVDGIGGHEGSGGSTVSIDGGDGADTIYISSIDDLSGVSIVAGSGDSINVGSGGANYLFDSTDAVTINGAKFTASSADTSASLESSDNITSIKNAWNGTVVLSGENSLADIDGSIVSAAGNYQIVDGKLASSNDISNNTPSNITPATNEINTDSNVIPVTTETDTTSTVTPVTTETDTNVINVSNGKNYDIVFIIDVSGTMQDDIAKVKDGVTQFATSLKNSGVGNVRFGLVSYMTNSTVSSFSENDTTTYLTSDVEQFQTAVSELSTVTGADEYGLSAVETAMSIVSDEDDTTKRFIVVTDEDYDDKTLLNATGVDNILKSRGIVMDVVGDEDTPIYNDYCRSEWEPLANGTGGKFYLLRSGFPSIFADITTDIINIVDLNLVPENQTGYFVATQNSDTYTTPIFQTTGAAGNDTTVGAVNEINVYVADSDTDRQQTIIITDGWNATATKNNDKLLINGVSATVTGSDGADVFSLSSDTRTITLMDLNIDEDKLSFGNYIMPGTMQQSIEDNHLVLSADNLRVDIPAMSEMTEEFLNYNVSNAGDSNTIRELIYGDGRVIISFANFNFSFTAPTTDAENFSFL